MKKNITLGIKWVYLSWANGLAELACNASLLARRIASQRVLTSESRT
jgi:hypothetical protein